MLMDPDIYVLPHSKPSRNKERVAEYIRDNVAGIEKRLLKIDLLSQSLIPFYAVKYRALEIFRKAPGVIHSIDLPDALYVCFVDGSPTPLGSEQMLLSARPWEGKTRRPNTPADYEPFELETSEIREYAMQNIISHLTVKPPPYWSPANSRWYEVTCTPKRSSITLKEACRIYISRWEFLVKVKKRKYRLYFLEVKDQRYTTKDEICQCSCCGKRKRRRKRKRAWN